MKVRSLVAIACAIVAIGAVAGAWLEARPRPTASDASALAERALRAARVPFAPVGADAVVAGVYESSAGERYDVWQVDVRRAGGKTIDLAVDRASGDFVQLDDVGEGRYALTDAQAQSIHDFDGRFPRLDDRVRRNLAASAAGLFVTGAAMCLMLFAPTRAAAPPADRRPPRA
jgi:hypothetical protein